MHFFHHVTSIFWEFSYLGSYLGSILTWALRPASTMGWIHMSTHGICMHMGSNWSRYTYVYQEDVGETPSGSPGYSLNHHPPVPP